MLQEHERVDPSESFRVVHYYCTARGTGTGTAGPDPETVLRSLCRRLAWLPTGILAEPALRFWNEWQNRKTASDNNKPGPKDWEQLFADLLDDTPGSIIIAIDALDECSKPAGLLGTLRRTLTPRHRVRLLCSSREEINVKYYFDGPESADIIVYEVNSSWSKTSNDMRRFVDHSVGSPPDQAKWRSVFCASAVPRSIKSVLTTGSQSRQGRFVVGAERLPCRRSKRNVCLPLEVEPSHAKNVGSDGFRSGKQSCFQIQNRTRSQQQMKHGGLSKTSKTPRETSTVHMTASISPTIDSG